MVLDKLHTLCLDSFCNDYENIESVMTHCRAELDTLNKDEIAAIIRELHLNKLITAYSYNEKTREFERIAQADPYSDYYYINKLGREILDNNWKAEYVIDDE